MNEKKQRNLDVKRPMMARLNEVLLVDWGTDERTDVEYVAQWEQRSHEFETVDAVRFKGYCRHCRKGDIARRTAGRGRTCW